MSLNVTSISPGTCLVSKLRDHIVQMGVETPVHIVLPTQRLVTFLTRELAAANGGAALLPSLWTWDQFSRELCHDYEQTESVMVSSQCEILLSKILENRADHKNKGASPGLDLISPPHAHELLYLDSQLERSGLRDTAKSNLLAWIDRDWHYSPDARESITARVESIFAALGLFHDVLAQNQRVTESRHRTTPLQWLLENPEELTKSIPAGNILIAGLTSLPNTEATLLEMLSRDKRVEIWIDEPGDKALKSPLAQLRKRLGPQEDDVPQNSREWARGVKAIYEYETPLDEIMGAVRWAKDQLARQIPAHEIAIIVPDEAAYAPILASMTASFEVPVNIPLAQPWQSTPPGAWTQLIRDASRQPTADNICQFIVHPYSAALGLVAGTPAPEPDALTKAQLSLRNAPFVSDKTSQHLKSEIYLNHFKAFLDTALHPWLDGLRHFLRFGHTNQSESRFDKDAFSDLLRAVEKTVVGVRHAQSATFSPVFEAADLVTEIMPLLGLGPDPSFSSWLGAVWQCASQEKIRPVGEPLSDLQVIGLTEARYIPFQAVLILGCVEGSFPHALPRDHLIDNSMRRVMGLPGWQDLESLEDTTFHLLTSRLENVALSYARTDAGNLTTRSRWIERLVPRVKPRQISAPWEQVVMSPVAESAGGSADLEGICGNQARLFDTLSASSLDKLLTCPYKFLLAKNRLEAVRSPDDQESRDIGILLHRIVEHFFKTSLDPRMDEASRLSNYPREQDAYKSWALERLHKITELICKDHELRSPQIQHMTGSGWDKIAGILTSIRRAGFLPDQVVTERKIGADHSVRLPLGDFSPKITGSVDALFRDGERLLLIDYKTSAAPPPGKFKAGKAPQLPLYMWTERPGQLSANMAAGFINLSGGSLSIYAVSPDATDDFRGAKLLGPRQKPVTPDEVWETTLGLIQKRIAELKDLGRFKADPQNCAFCEYSGVCKVQDPRYKDRINAQSSAAAGNPDDDDDTAAEGGEA